MTLVQSGQNILFISSREYERSTELLNLVTAQAVPGVVDTLDFADLSSLASMAESKYDSVVSVANSSTHHHQALLLDLWKVLKSSGHVLLLEAFERTFEHSSAIINALTVSGFSNTSISEYSGIVLVTSTKPNFSAGATHAIKLKKKVPTPTEDAWSKPMDASSGELIDEASLLTEADMAKPVLQDDCEVGTTKKACKNCSCGRAEMGEEPKKKITLAMLENPAVNSGCGSCALGDAFRCGGCPYKGLPAFKPGEKIVLPSDFDMDLIETE